MAVNPQYAWRWQVKENGKPTGEIINWLKDENMLPAEIPSARILAFNYASQWLRTNSQVRVQTIATQLLRAVHEERQLKSTEAHNRPIIFVGHSFGGIVIEQVSIKNSKRQIGRASCRERVCQYV